MNHKRHICIVSTVPLSLNVFMRLHIKNLCKKYNITLVTNGLPEDVFGLISCHVHFFPISIQRKISPIKDLIALFKLWKLAKRKQFDCVQSLTPKAGLLAMLASRLSGVPIRVHIFTGQVWAVKKGVVRWVLKYLDKILAGCATHLLADSLSQRAFLISEGITKNQKIEVLAKGSICGVDMKRFCFLPQARNDIRNKLGISQDEIVLLYIGRLNRDKGMLDLAAAFNKLCATPESNIKLLIVGTDEQKIQPAILQLCSECQDRIIFIDFTDSPEEFMSASDILCLPSYREGFGSVIIEAASVGIPAVASRIYGITDAVEEGQSGFLHEPGNIDELAEMIHQLVEDPALRRRMGEYARSRARLNFSSDQVASAWLEYYERLLNY